MICMHVYLFIAPIPPPFSWFLAAAVGPRVQQAAGAGFGHGEGKAKRPGDAAAQGQEVRLTV